YIRQLLLSNSDVSPQDATTYLFGERKDAFSQYLLCLFIIESRESASVGGLEQPPGDYLLELLQSKWSVQHAAVCLDAGDGQFFIIIHSNEPLSELDVQLRELAPQILDEVHKLEWPPVTCVWSKPVNDPAQLCNEYITIKQYSKYRFVYGKHSCI